MEAGVRIYEYQPTMYHCKVMVIDDQWATVGSCNFDNRSFRLNDEANLNMLDSSSAADQARVFYNDREKAQQVTLEAWRKRPFGEKLWDAFAVLFRSQLQMSNAGPIDMVN